MTDQQTSANNAQNIAEAIQEVSDRAQLLVREEIELAKAEVTTKVTKLVKGAVVALAASVFVVAGLGLVLQGLSWLAWYELFPSNQFFWGFFVVAAALFLLGALAGFIASRAFKAGSPPKPEMAIDEAKRIRETVQSSHPEQTV
jgi:Putative Actinobacterial Holin-X, holin superfamily III